MEKCIVCNSRLKFLGENEGVAIFQCPACSLGVTGNGEKEEYEAYHRDQVYIREEPQFRNIFQKRVDVILRFKKKGKALEVGASTGLFLSLLKERGWEVEGIEPSKPAANSARKRGIKIYETTFEKANIQGKFDLVIFNHVLEHMEDPKRVLKKVNRILRKRGLVLIDVPNFASLAARARGLGWKYILPREHRWHFTPASLFVLLEKTGFTPIFWEAHSGIWGYGRPWQEVWQALRERKKRFFGDVVTALPTWVLTKLKAGTGLTVIARRVEDWK